MRMGEACDFFVLILEGHVEVTIGREEHKFQEGPFRCFGEQMLEQALTMSSSPVSGLTNKGTHHSLSLYSSSSQDGKELVQTRSAYTQPKDNGKGNRSSSADAGQSFKKSNSCDPEFTVWAVKDVLSFKRFARTAIWWQMITWKAGMLCIISYPISYQIHVQYYV